MLDTFVDVLVCLAALQVLSLGVLLPLGLGVRKLWRRGAAPKPRRTWRRILIANGVAVALVASALGTLHFGYSEELLQWVLGMAEKRTGIRVTYEHAEVQVVGGSADLRGVRIVRRGHPEGDLDLRAERVNVDIAALGLWRPTKRVESLVVHGIRGTVNRSAKPAPKRHGFFLEKLALVDASLTVHLERRDRWITLPVSVPKLESRDLRSHLLLLDLLRHSRGSGRLAGAEFALSSKSGEDSRTVRWSIRHAPVALLRDLLAGPFRRLTAGSCHVHATERWPEEGQVDGDWDLECAKLALDAGAGKGLFADLRRKGSEWLRAREGRLSLAFGFRTDRDRFDVSPLPGGGAMAFGIARAAAVALAKKIGSDAIAKGARSLLQRVFGRTAP